MNWFVSIKVTGRPSATWSSASRRPRVQNQLKLDPTIYEGLQKEKVETGDVIYIEANSGAVKVISFRNFSGSHSTFHLIHSRTVRGVSSFLLFVFVEARSFGHVCDWIRSRSRRICSSFRKVMFIKRRKSSKTWTLHDLDVANAKPQVSSTDHACIIHVFHLFIHLCSISLVSYNLNFWVASGYNMKVKNWSYNLRDLVSSRICHMIIIKCRVMSAK